MAAAKGKIDVDALTRKIEGKLSATKSLSPRCSIFKIPAILLRHNQKAYEPNAFSFGPFHHQEENLKPTETIKVKYLHDLISRLSPPNDPNPAQTTTLMVKKFTEAISKNSEAAQQYYAGPIGMGEDQLVEVLVLDGCFIIELFRKKAYEDLREENDPIFSMSCLLQFLMHDLILLENQVPWMVLEILFELTSTSVDKNNLVPLAIEFFGNIFSTQPTPYYTLLSHPHKHILDLLRNSLVLTSTIQKHETDFKDNIEHMPSATTLDDFGIKFKMDGTSKSILDIQFNEKKGEMTVPPLLIQETTETVFRNLIGLEQCCPNYPSRITSYAVLLDNLINTHKDMEILCKNRAITSWLNIDKATKSFDNLYIDTYVKESFYRHLTREVDKYCQRGWNRNRRSLVRDYIKPPWVLVSIIAASIALILSFLQTLFTIMDKK